MNPKKAMPRHIIISLCKTKDKEKFLKAAREKWHPTYSRKTTCIAADFSSEIIKAKRKWHSIFQVLKEKNFQFQIPILNKIIFQELRGNQDILRWRETKRICHQKTHTKRMAKQSSLTRKETIKEENLGHQQRGKMGKYNRLLFSWVFKIMFDKYSKVVTLI